MFILLIEGMWYLFCFLSWEKLFGRTKAFSVNNDQLHEMLTAFRNAVSLCLVKVHNSELTALLSLYCWTAVSHWVGCIHNKLHSFVFHPKTFALVRLLLNSFKRSKGKLDEQCFLVCSVWFKFFRWGCLWQHPPTRLQDQFSNGDRQKLSFICWDSSFYLFIILAPDRQQNLRPGCFHMS